MPLFLCAVKYLGDTFVADDKLFFKLQVRMSTLAQVLFSAKCYHFNKNAILKKFSLSAVSVHTDHPLAKTQALARYCEGVQRHCRHTLEWPQWPAQRSGPWGRARSVLADLSRPLWGESMLPPSELRYNLPPCRTKRFKGHSFLPLPTLEISLLGSTWNIFCLNFLRIHTFMSIVDLLFTVNLTDPNLVDVVPSTLYHNTKPPACTRLWRQERPVSFCALVCFTQMVFEDKTAQWKCANSYWTKHRHWTLTVPKLHSV